MENRVISPGGALRGTLKTPGDKSISHRSAILSALAKPSSPVILSNYSTGNDCQKTLQCLRALGVKIYTGKKTSPSTVKITPPGLQNLKEPKNILNCGNSGTTMRLLCGVLSSLPFYSVLTGDQSLRERPMDRVTDPLKKMGAEIFGRQGGKFPPLSISGGKLSGIEHRSNVPSAQVKSAIILAGLSAEGETWVSENAPSRDHTERMLFHFGVELLNFSPAVKSRGHLRVGVRGGSIPEARSMEIPGDISSAAFFMAGALILENSELTIQGVGLNSTRTGFLEVIKKMGAQFDILSFQEEGEPRGDIRIKYQPLQPFSVGGSMVPTLIDEIPIMAVLATQAHGVSTIKDVQELRVKESDRLKAISENLKAMGANIEEKHDGLIIEGPTRLRGTVLNSFGDHRIAMAMAIASLVAEGDSLIKGAACASISFPGFYEKLEELRSGRR